MTDESTPVATRDFLRALVRQRIEAHRERREGLVLRRYQYGPRAHHEAEIRRLDAAIERLEKSLREPPPETAPDGAGDE